MAKVKATRVKEAVSLIFDEIKRCQEEFVSPEEIEHTQKYLRFSVANYLETNNGHASFIKMKLEYNMDVNDWINGFKAVTPQRIREVARKYLPKSIEKGKYVLSIRDPFKKN